MGNALYAQLAAVVLLFAFLGFIFFAAKNWRWYDVTALAFVFLFSLFFVFLAASVLKTHQEWGRRHQQLAQQLEQEQEKTEILRFGPLDANAEDPESLDYLQNELERVVMDRGRVWRDVQAQPQGNQIVFRFPERNVVGADEPPPRHGLQPNMIVYGFKEKENPEGWKVPAFFMGEFMVQSADGESVTVVPTLPMDPMQVAEVGRGDTTWALYEVMPNDAHYKFAELDEDKIRELLSPGGWHGRPAMTSKERYEEAIAQYLRDGDEATDADPPENTWVEVELTQPWQVPVDANTADAQLPTRIFDISGLAQSPHLQHGGPVELEAGQTIRVDAETAERIISQGIAKPGKRYYRRPLRDYAYSFDEIHRRIRGLTDRVALTTKENNTLQQAIDKGKKQVAYREDEKQKLTEDLQFVSKERDAMTQYREALKNQFDAARANLYALYTENLELVDRLRRIEQAIVNAVEQQLAAAGAER